jgi:hypothetical protein
MSLQHSIKHLSAIALIGLVWGCNTSKQAIVSKSSSGEVYDDLYASTSDVRPTTLGGRIYNEQGYDESTYQAPVYRNGNSTNNSTQGTNEYYSQNWLNSRSVYQNQDDYSAGYNNGYNNGFANGLNNRYGNFGLNNWYANPAISFGLGYSRWSPFGFSTMGIMIHSILTLMIRFGDGQVAVGCMAIHLAMDIILMVSEAFMTLMAMGFRPWLMEADSMVAITIITITT